MKPEFAKYTICTLVSNSHFLKGLLYGKNAWGKLGFPDQDKEPSEHANLVQLFRDLATGLETKEDKV
jgi:hypothetical protein